jgi:medium-chain acyl-[acyl-carrier-protein] hydrolase
MTTAATGRTKPRAIWGATKPDAPRLLLCLPHAGAGASIFGGIIRAAPPTLDVVALQAPGRENRIRETPYTDAADLVAELVGVVGPLLDRPYAVFGHSVGALVAFELVRAIREEGLPAPAHLYLSARGAAHLPVERVDLRDKDDDYLLDVLRKLGGTPDAALGRAFVELVLPAFRADLTIQMEYEYRYGPPLDVPVTAFRASDDDRADDASVAAWGEHTTGPFVLRRHEGDHFTAVVDPSVLLEEIARTEEGWS